MHTNVLRGVDNFNVELDILQSSCITTTAAEQGKMSDAHSARIDGVAEQNIDGFDFVNIATPEQVRRRVSNVAFSRALGARSESQSNVFARAKDDTNCKSKMPGKRIEMLSSRPVPFHIWERPPTYVEHLWSSHLRSLVGLLAPCGAIGSKRRFWCERHGTFFLQLIRPHCFNHSDRIQQTNLRLGNKTTGFWYYTFT